MNWGHLERQYYHCVCCRATLKVVMVGGSVRVLVLGAFPKVPLEDVQAFTERILTGNYVMGTGGVF